jgi:hypothetical protein
MDNKSHDEYINEKIKFIQDHIKSLFYEITNLPSPWSYCVDSNGRVFFIK